MRILRKLGPAFRGAARHRSLRAELGSAVLEMALILSVLGAPLLLGTTDMGTWVYDSIEISSAAHAGALYGMMSTSNAVDAAAITSAAQADAADFGSNLNVTSTVYYACSLAEGGTQYTTKDAATAGCAGAGNHPLEFVQVTASATASAAIQFPGLPSSFPISSTSVMEVEE